MISEIGPYRYLTVSFSAMWGTGGVDLWGTSYLLQHQHMNPSTKSPKRQQQQHPKESTPNPYIYNVRPNESNNRLLRRQAAETNPQCLDNKLRNGLQPLPSPASNPQPTPQSSRAHLSVRTDMHGRQLRREGLFPARGEPEGYRGFVS